MSPKSSSSTCSLAKTKDVLTPLPAKSLDCLLQEADIEFNHCLRSVQFVLRQMGPWYAFGIMAEGIIHFHIDSMDQEGQSLRHGTALMRIVSALALLSLLSVIPLLGQSNSKRIFLSPKSNITTAEIAEGFAKYCPNIVLTQNEAKADYVLEAAETVSAADGTTHRHWHFTLMNEGGDVLMTTHPETHFRNRFKHHFESVCKFVNK